MSEVILEILSHSIMITGLVVVMMMLIECFNVWSKGRFSGSMRKSGPLQVVAAALLGAVPGCMGGFAVVSMYAHGLMSFGALVAMMIASSGDEAFLMLAMIPDKAWMIILGLTVLAIAAGLAVDCFRGPSRKIKHCSDLSLHDQDIETPGTRRFGWKRVGIILGVGVFLAALAFGLFEEGGEEGPEAEFILGGINLLSEDWMNVMFAIFGVAVLVVAILCSDHFLEEHLFHHVVREHLPKIFLWTAGTLSVIALLMSFVDVSAWIGDNVVLMVLVAAAIGIIPESGPHMIFVTLFASGIVPLPVLVASCISQDGHAGIPLLAEDRKSFLLAKGINVVIAVAAGLLMVLF